MKVLVDLDMQVAARIYNLQDAVTNQEPATFGQLNAAIEGRSWKDPVRAASTANLTLSGTQTVDGVALVAGNRILVKNQTTGAQNGIYVVGASTWFRSPDANISAEVRQMAMAVQEGSVNGDTQWLMTTNDPITLNTTALVFVQTGTGATYTGGTGITVAGTVVSIDATVVARKATATIGDGSAVTFNVTHNLASDDVQVSVRETASPFEEVLAGVSFPSNNVTTITFNQAPSTGQYRVSLKG